MESLEAYNSRIVNELTETFTEVGYEATNLTE
jgi:hypothetical protein